MGIGLWAFAGGCALFGLLVGWAIGRFLSRTLLRAVWLGLAITLVWGLFPAVQNWLGVEHDGFDGVARVAMAVLFIGPTFLASLLGGWLGLRQKMRKLAE
ncbi:hypothetical protein [Nioella nitratireducens]|uniref:hypothetical protein n=1 Tax=Nioella nitratireducens TaxID=1287720 RepID=UPI0008FD479B|nr:hypothetical protein [Nioella nitratireducens]